MAATDTMDQGNDTTCIKECADCGQHYDYRNAGIMCRHNGRWLCAWCIGRLVSLARHQQK